MRCVAWALPVVRVCVVCFGHVYANNYNRISNSLDLLTQCTFWCWLGPVLLGSMVMLAAAAFVFAFSQRRKLKVESDGSLLRNQYMGSETGILLKDEALTFTPTPLSGAFAIPFEQLEIGPVIAAGAEGQVRKGRFGGKAVAIKELIAVMFDPEETQTFQARAMLAVKWIAWIG